MESVSGGGQRGGSGRYTFPAMKWPEMVVPSGGVTRDGEPEATGRIRIAKR
jgi:hypothetical protein